MSNASVSLIAGQPQLKEAMSPSSLFDAASFWPGCRAYVAAVCGLSLQRSRSNAAALSETYAIASR